MCELTPGAAQGAGARLARRARARLRPLGGVHSAGANDLLRGPADKPAARSGGQEVRPQRPVQQLALQAGRGRGARLAPSAQPWQRVRPSSRGRRGRCSGSAVCWSCARCTPAAGHAHTAEEGKADAEDAAALARAQRRAPSGRAGRKQPERAQGCSTWRSPPLQQGPPVAARCKWQLLADHVTQRGERQGAHPRARARAACDQLVPTVLGAGRARRRRRLAGILLVSIRCVRVTGGGHPCARAAAAGGAAPCSALACRAISAAHAGRAAMTMRARRLLPAFLTAPAVAPGTASGAGGAA